MVRIRSRNTITQQALETITHLGKSRTVESFLAKPIHYKDDLISREEFLTHGLQEQLALSEKAWKGLQDSGEKTLSIGSIKQNVDDELDKVHSLQTRLTAFNDALHAVTQKSLLEKIRFASTPEKREGRNMVEMRQDDEASKKLTYLEKEGAQLLNYMSAWFATNGKVEQARLKLIASDTPESDALSTREKSLVRSAEDARLAKALQTMHEDFVGLMHNIKRNAAVAAR